MKSKPSVTARKASRDGRTVWKDTRGNGFCVGVRFPMPHKIQPLKLKVMKATMNPTKMEARIKQKLRALIGNVTHMQNVADQTLELIKSTLTEDERNDSDTCRVIENLSCVCEEALQVLCEELKRGTRLYERLCNENQSTSFNAFNHGTEK